VSSSIKKSSSLILIDSTFLFPKGQFQIALFLPLLKNHQNCSATFRQSTKGLIFQEAWKPGMAFAASQDRFMHFLKYQTFGATTAE